MGETVVVIFGDTVLLLLEFPDDLTDPPVAEPPAPPAPPFAVLLFCVPVFTLLPMPDALAAPEPLDAVLLPLFFNEPPVADELPPAPPVAVAVELHGLLLAPPSLIEPDVEAEPEQGFDVDELLPEFLTPELEFPPVEVDDDVAVELHGLLLAPPSFIVPLVDGLPLHGSASLLPPVALELELLDGLHGLPLLIVPLLEHGLLVELDILVFVFWFVLVFVMLAGGVEGSLGVQINAMPSTTS